jgi:hypothetical protein
MQRIRTQYTLSARWWKKKAAATRHYYKVHVVFMRELQNLWPARCVIWVIFGAHIEHRARFPGAGHYVLAARYQLVKTQLLSRSYTPRILQCEAQEIRKMLRAQYLYLLPLQPGAHINIFSAAKRDRA